MLKIETVYKVVGGQQIQADYILERPSDAEAHKAVFLRLLEGLEPGRKDEAGTVVFFQYRVTHDGAVLESEHVLLVQDAWMVFEAGPKLHQWVTRNTADVLPIWESFRNVFDHATLLLGGLPGAAK